MLLDKSGVLGLLEEAVDAELTRKITLVAVGGTAMTLLDLKPSTIDIDFTYRWYLSGGERENPDASALWDESEPFSPPLPPRCSRR